MKTISVRDLCHKRPQVEGLLQAEGELKPRKRFSAEEQAKWRRSVFCGRPSKQLVKEMLESYRKERWE